jgi:choline-sulfatase
VPNLNFFTFAPYYLHLGLSPIDRPYLGDRESTAIMNWLKKNATGDGKPFFIWYHTTMVHQPYRPPDSADLPAPLEELEERPGIRAVLNGAIVPFGSVQFEPGDKPILDALYDAEMRRVDRLFGKMLELLRERELTDSTLVILSADHGEELLDHGFVGHASTSLHAKLYEELIHIPLIMAWPGHVPPGLAISDPVSQIDILPTVARLLDLPVPQGVQGLDLFKSRPDRPLFLESVSGGNQTPKSRQDEWIRAIRVGRWKYISTDELYDLILDPKETTNLIGQESKLANQLKNRMASFFSRCDDLAGRLFPATPETPSAGPVSQCPHIFTPGNGTTLEYDRHTGALLFDWEGNMETTYLIEYDIGTGDHHVEGRYEVQGNHQVLGPLPRELWANMKQWNPFRIRVSPKQDPPCWSEWVEFRF